MMCPAELDRSLLIHQKLRTANHPATEEPENFLFKIINNMKFVEEINYCSFLIYEVWQRRLLTNNMIFASLRNQS